MANPYTGEIRVFGGNFAPVGWAFCDGSLIAISQNPELFDLIGTTYGGDGTQTFALPDLRGRALIHQGQGNGLSAYNPGETGGVPLVTLTAQQLPSHTHAFLGVGASATSPNPGPSVALAATPTGEPFYSTANAPATLSPQAITPAGGAQPHSNQQPYVVISYIIALFGIFPSQN